MPNYTSMTQNNSSDTSTALYTKHNYINRAIDVLLYPVYEYDMRDGGFSIIKEFGLLPPSSIKVLSQMNKFDRHVAVGKEVGANRDLSIDLMDGFVEARRAFFVKNDLDARSVLSIKKDAVFVIGRKCKEVNFGKYIKFALKNSYTSYYRVNNIELYYSSKSRILDVKNLGKESFILTHPLLKEVSKILFYYENNKSLVFKKLQQLRLDYLNRKFPISYYRELNSEGYFRTSHNIGNVLSVTISDENIAASMNIKDIDISYNYENLILPLINILI